MNLEKQNLYQHEIKLHPCVIDNKSCIIYPKGLHDNAPDFFNKLQHFFKCKGIELKEDRRGNNKINQHGVERRRWMPLLMFTASMLFDNLAFSAEPVETTNNSIQKDIQRKIELRLISNIKNSINDEQLLKLNSKKNNKTQTLQSNTAIKLYTIFKNHYVKQSNDPKYINSDFKEMANYYSYFPEAVNLITGLNTKNWTLMFDENTWSTIAKGRALEVDEATIHFNTRSAAKLKLHNSCRNNPVCIASPADALLHELLHTQSMLINPEEFISQGGMSSKMYPWKHEYAIIKKENILYAIMSKRDTQKRPYRNEHTGRKIMASCATCIK